jgi:bacterial/archaeal transporter family protein
MDVQTLIYATISLLGWGVGSFLSKLATNRIGERAVFWDMLGYAPGIIIYCLLMFRSKDLITGDRVGIMWALISGLIGSFGIICFYLAITRKDASVAVPITALYPALTAILAIIFLKEAVTMYKVLGIVLATLAIFFLSL